ncbi:MAG: hypothetical protein KDI75_03745, partial [Xanthomonadales bacterium]|nr:hypothetical protein [Xanthomonadales bacterium]
RSMRERGEQIAHREVQGAVNRQIPTLTELAKFPATPTTNEEQVEADESGVEITLEELEFIEQGVRDAAGPDRSLMVSAHNALTRYLKA